MTGGGGGIIGFCVVVLLLWLYHCVLLCEPNVLDPLFHLLCDVLRPPVVMPLFITPIFDRPATFPKFIGVCITHAVLYSAHYAIWSF